MAAQAGGDGEHRSDDPAELARDLLAAEVPGRPDAEDLLDRPDSSRSDPRHPVGSGPGGEAVDLSEGEAGVGHRRAAGFDGEVELRPGQAASDR